MKNKFNYKKKVESNICFEDIFNFNKPLAIGSSRKNSKFRKFKFSLKLPEFLSAIINKKNLLVILVILIICILLTFLILKYSFIPKIEHITLNNLQIVDTSGIITSTPVLYDINQDKRIDLIVGDENGTVHVYDGPSFKKIFQYITAHSIIASPILGDINLDNKIEICVATEDGRIYVLNDQGTLLYKSRKEFFNESIFSTPVIIEKKRKKYLVFTGMNGTICCIEGVYGIPEWKNSDAKACGDSIFSTPVTLDINNDEIKDIIYFSYNGYISAINGENGNELWFRKLESGVKSSPAFGYFINKKMISAAVTDINGNLYIIDPVKGEIIWQTDLKKSIVSSPAACDFDKDGYDEIVIGNTEGQISVLSPHRKKFFWSFNTAVNNSFKASPICYDLNYDGIKDIIAVSGSGRLYLIHGLTGKMITRALDIKEKVTASPLFADINYDGLPEIIIASEAGKIHAISVVTSPDVLVKSGAVIIPGFLKYKELQGNYN